MHSKPLILCVAFALAALLLPSLASADGITWTLQNVSLNDGGTVTGSFNYNATTNNYSNFNVSTSLGSSLPGFAYTTVTDIVFFNSTIVGLGPNPTNTSNFTGENFLEIFFLNPLTNSGGTDPVFLTEILCTNSTCGSSTDRSGAGSVTTTPVATPEPNSLLLLASGLIALIAIRRRG